MRFCRIRHYIKAGGISLTVALALCLPGLSISAAAGTAIVSVYAPAHPVSPGDRLMVSIIVQPNNAIVGAQFNLSFNPSLVTVNSVSEGNLLKQNGANTYFAPGEIDNNAGTITGVAGTIIAPGETVSTPGTFAVITMTAGSTEGTCPLTFSNVIVGDINGQPVPVNTVNGQISIDQPPVLNGIGNKTVNVGSLLTFTISATDPEGNPLTYSASNLPSGASFNASSRAFSWTPTTSQAGTYPNVHFEVTDGTLSDSENITITVSSPSPSGGGGGGGGGGGFIPINVVQVDGMTLPGNVRTDVYGVVQKTVQLQTKDQQVTLNISEGTQLHDSKGLALTTLSAMKLDSLPEQPSEKAVVLAYEFGPDGARFNPPLTVTFKYDPQTLPAGTEDNNISLAFWDGSKWETVESTLDNSIGTVTAKISHFSQYAVLAQLPPPPPQPAIFTLSDFKITPDKVNPDDPVTINTVVSNTGGSQGKYTVVLKINGAEADIRELTVDANNTESVVFQVEREMPGEYAVDINGNIGKFMVNTPPGMIAEISPTPEPAPSTETPALRPGEKATLPVTWMIIIGIGVSLCIVMGLFATRRHKT